MQKVNKGQDMKKFKYLENIFMNRNIDTFHFLSEKEKKLLDKGYKCEYSKFVSCQPERLNPEDSSDSVCDSLTSTNK